MVSEYLIYYKTKRMLKVDKEEIDLGTVQFGKVYEFDYEVTNTIEKDSVINKVQTSCSSCTKAAITKKIKGNETTKLHITYTPGAVGSANKKVTVFYDTDQVLVVKFKAIVNG